jgi:hypothetical protein
MVGCARVPPDRPVSPCQGRRLVTKWVTHRPVADAHESARMAKRTAQTGGDRCRPAQAGSYVVEVSHLGYLTATRSGVTITHLFHGR